MSKRKATRKEKKAADKYGSATPTPTAATEKAKVKTRAAVAEGPSRELTYGPEFYKWMGGGFALVIIGMLLMTGGEMPDPNTWDESIIYSFRRITLAPIVIMAGIGVVAYAILKK